MKSSQERVSVIVPVYNVERYIDDCLLSLRAQTYHSLTIILVNDGSTDRSADRAYAHARIDGRIKIIEQENQGLGAARNTGLAHADGEFITFVDSDDFVSSSLLETLLAAQHESHSDIVSCRHLRITESASFLSLEQGTDPKLTPRLSHYEKVLGLFSSSVAWARLFRREILSEPHVNFPDHLPHEDLFFTYKLLRHCSHTVVEDQLYFWRQRVNSLSSCLTKLHLPVPWRLRDDTRDFLNSVGASEWEHALAARRNLMILSQFWTRAVQSEAFLDDLRNMSIARAKEIDDDFEMTHRFKLECPQGSLLPLAQQLRTAGAGCKTLQWSMESL